MKIYTSYFAQLKKINKMDNLVPIAICRYVPKWYDGLTYLRIAPDYDMINGMKNSDTRDFFAVKYVEEILKCYDASQVLHDLEELSCGKDVVLLCYEKPMDFCHRHIVAKWLGVSPGDAELKF